MKKFFGVLFLLSFMFLITGCMSNKEVVTKCELTSDQSSQGYNLKTTYQIYSKGNVVNKVSMNEVVTSDKENVLTYFETYLNNSYKSLDDKYGGYDFKITKTTKDVSSNVTIDYNKMNLKKYISDNSSMKAFVNKDNKMTLKGVKKIYETLGATCEK